MEDQLEKEKITTPKRVIIEVGSGSTPFPVFHKARKVEADELYVGIDLDVDAALTAKQFERYGTIKSGVISFIAGRGEHLPVKNNTAEEVLLIDVIGNPRVAGRVADKKRLGKFLDPVGREVFRVLKSGGSLKIIESYSPYTVPSQIIDLAQGIGFILESWLTVRDSEAIKNFMLQYKPTIALSEDAFLLQFRKP